MSHLCFSTAFRGTRLWLCVIPIFVFAALVGACHTVNVGECPLPSDPALGYRLQFLSDGTLTPACRQRELDILDRVRSGPPVTDIIVFAHGWWQDAHTAEETYQVFTRAMQVRRPAELSTFAPLLVGFYWPSAYFPVSIESDQARLAERADTTSLKDELRRVYDWIAHLPDSDRDLGTIATLLAKELRGEVVTAADVSTVAAILKRWHVANGGEEVSDIASSESDTEAPGERSIFDLDVSSLAGFLLKNSYVAHPNQDVVKKRHASILTILNVFTFWEMKRRAGRVGERGGYMFLKQLNRVVEGRPIRIHLIGHSFGGKVLMASVGGPYGSPPNHATSLFIIQGAASHFSVAPAENLDGLNLPRGSEGRYAVILKARPIASLMIVTVSKRDLANSLLYPLAVGVSGDVLEARDEAVPLYGALGANGALRSRATTVVLRKGHPTPKLPEGPFAIYNVRADEVISSHSGYNEREIFDLLWSVIAAAH